MNRDQRSHIRLLHVDDEEAFRQQIREVLIYEDYKVDTVIDGVEAINAVQSKKYDLILLDISMPKVDGIEVLHFVKKNYPATEVIMLTGVDDLKIAVDCMKEGAFHYLTKPFLIDELSQVIERALDHKILKNENSLMRSELSRISDQTELIGESDSFKTVLSIASRVAPTDSSVLIQGPSGTGKELIADFIHKNSSRSSMPLVAINCAAIPDTLLESELFGHEKGAFTDARTQKQGLIELADGGTLFLDEVGDISTIIQPKLLRFVQTGEFRRVGGNSTLHADVRIISATNKDLREEVKQTRFREDLLYRLNVITLTVPPLRERKSDIPLLARNYLSKKIKAKKTKNLSAASVSFLMRYDWPGNVRELENVLESAAILSNGDEIEPKDILLPNMQSNFMNQAITSTYPVKDVSLKELERCHIGAVLQNVSGDKKLAAKLLGISLKTLYTKISHYNLK
ncbi:MAG: sigma-54-dependent Fis family transcriptional regulator [Ignavibacteriales bacterium]|nr:sigma-54-dependent Fis family transcriptional regulator [Ignavibacteriales bacterium]